MKHLLLTTIAAVVLVGCEKAPTKQDIQFLNAVQSMDIERTKKILSEGNVNINVKGSEEMPQQFIMQLTTTMRK